MIPLKDDNPVRIFPIVTIGLIAANTLIWLYQISLGPAQERFIFTYGAIPNELISGIESTPAFGIPIQLTLITSMFLHGGLFHLGGNMLYLWIFGNNVEEAMGTFRFTLFYLICGVVAVYGNALVSPQSTVPMIGASGAISGVLGAYLLLHPHAKVLTLIPLGFYTGLVRVPAVVVLGFWIVVQLINGLFHLGQPGGGVAWFAHIGGFVAGLLLVVPFKRRGVRLFR